METCYYHSFSNRPSLARLRSARQTQGLQITALERKDWLQHYPADRLSSIDIQRDYPGTYVSTTTHQHPPPTRLLFLCAWTVEGLGCCATSLCTPNMHPNTPTYQCESGKGFIYKLSLFFGGGQMLQQYCSGSFMQMKKSELKLQSVTERCRREQRVWKLWQPDCFYGNSKEINCCGCWRLACC